MGADPYAGLNMDNLRRLTAVGWIVGVVLVLSLTVLRPPTDVIGAWGRVVSIGFALAILAALAWFRRHPERATPDVIYAAGYAGAAMVGLLQWLSGGWSAPYHHLDLLFVLNGALGHSRRRFLTLFGVLVAVALLPMLYTPGHRILLNIVVELALWLVVGLICAELMQRVRLQRLEIEAMALGDALTGLANRRAFDATAAIAIDHGPFALAIADVDRFKEVNDAFGHLAGDACLAAVARTLAEHARAGDAVFRWGGDEFAVLLPGAGEDEAEEVCRRLECLVAEYVAWPDGRPATVTFGAAVFEPGLGLEALVRAADSAMLDRKAAARSARTPAGRR